jgi:hypothetical protein
VSCRSPTSSLITPLGFFSRGAPPPGLPTRSRRRHVPLYTAVTAMAPTSPRPSARADKGHVPLYTTVRPSGLPWSRPSAHAGTGLPSPPAAARLFAHPAPATGPAWLQRIPPGPGAHTVRLPLGTGHGKGPCSARARIGFPKSSWSRPQRASTVYRSRQPGLKALPDPATSRLDARAAQGPVRSTEHANRPTVLEKDPNRNRHESDYMTSTSHPRAGAARPSRDAAQGTWCESHTMAPAVCM